MPLQRSRTCRSKHCCKHKKARLSVLAVLACGFNHRNGEENDRTHKDFEDVDAVSVASGDAICRELRR